MSLPDFYHVEVKRGAGGFPGRGVVPGMGDAVTVTAYPSEMS